MIYTVTLNPAVDKELTVPALEPDRVLRAVETRLDVGGKGFNVSRMLCSLGVGSTAVALAGGCSGDYLRDGLQGLGIATEFVQVAGESRTNVSIVSENGTHYLKVNEPGPRVSEAELEALLDRVRGLAAVGDWWVLSGSLPPGAPPSIYAQLIEIVRDAGGRAVLDSSGEALRSGCGARPFLVKPNAEETAALLDGRVGVLEQAAAQIRALGPRSALISLGKDGALLGAPEGTWRAASPAVIEANPTGAGDSMVAGVVYALECGWPWPDVLRWGLACGAAAAGTPGTGTGTREMVERLAG